MFYIVSRHNHTSSKDLESRARRMLHDSIYWKHLYHNQQKARTTLSRTSQRDYKENHAPVHISFCCLLKASRKEKSRAKWRGWHWEQVPALEMMPMNAFLMLKRFLAWCKILYFLA